MFVCELCMEICLDAVVDWDELGHLGKEVSVAENWNTHG